MEEEKRLITLFDRTALSIRARQIWSTPDGLKVQVYGEDDVDKILTEKCRKLLLEIGLFVVPDAQKTLHPRSDSR